MEVRSVPAIGVLREAGTLYTHDAEALTGGGLHRDPAFQAVHDFGAKRFQAADLRGNIVGLDVKVDAALVLDALDLHDGFVGRRSSMR